MSRDEYWAQRLKNPSSKAWYTPITEWFSSNSDAILAIAGMVGIFYVIALFVTLMVDSGNGNLALTKKLLDPLGVFRRKTKAIKSEDTNNETITNIPAQSIQPVQSPVSMPPCAGVKTMPPVPPQNIPEIPAMPYPEKTRYGLRIVVILFSVLLVFFVIKYMFFTGISSSDYPMHFCRQTPETIDIIRVERKIDLMYRFNFKVKKTKKDNVPYWSDGERVLHLGKDKWRDKDSWYILCD